eukprot:jgi/Astpho2/591/Aster-x0944
MRGAPRKRGRKAKQEVLSYRGVVIPHGALHYRGACRTCHVRVISVQERCSAAESSAGGVSRAQCSPTEALGPRAYRGHCWAWRSAGRAGRRLLQQLCQALHQVSLRRKDETSEEPNSRVRLGMLPCHDQKHTCRPEETAKTSHDLVATQLTAELASAQLSPAHVRQAERGSYPMQLLLRLAAEQEGQELLSLAVSGHTVAAGAEGSILFWDRRTGAQAAVFDDTHSESVTQAALNLVSVARMGFYGSQQEKLWCTSNVESLHLWEWAAACEEDAPGGEGPLCSLEDARADLTKVLTKSAHGVPKEAELDYLISCQPVSADQLWVAAGSTTGFTGCFSVSEPASSGQPCHVGGPLLMTGQHTDIVRSLVWFDAEERRCISGGEDGKIIVWHAADEDIPVEQALKRQRLH